MEKITKHIMRSFEVLFLVLKSQLLSPILDLYIVLIIWELSKYREHVKEPWDEMFDYLYRGICYVEFMYEK